jgi:hypothetical protein
MLGHDTILLAGAATLAALGQMPPRDLIEGEHWKRARALVEARNGNDAETLYLKATIKQAESDLDAAEKLAEQAVAANPKEAEYHYRLSDITGEKAQAGQRLQTDRPGAHLQEGMRRRAVAQSDPRARALQHHGLLPARARDHRRRQPARSRTS